MSDKKAYDYIIIGAGSAGCTLANRLTEDRDASVLLLEAGGQDWNPLIHVPLGWGKILLNRLHDWGYFTEPEAQLLNREIECARGKVMGGHPPSMLWPTFAVILLILIGGKISA